MSLAAIGLPARKGRPRAPIRVTAGGNGTIYVGTYARNILVLDEATMRVRDTIKPSVGIPELSLSFDRKHSTSPIPATRSSRSSTSPRSSRAACSRCRRTA